MCQLTRRAAAEEGGGEKAKEKQDCGPCSSFVVCHAGLTTGRRAQQVSGCNRCGRYLGKGVRAAIPRHHTDSGLAAVGCISEGVRCWREGYCLIGPWSPGAQPPLWPDCHTSEPSTEVPNSSALEGHGSTQAQYLAEVKSISLTPLTLGTKEIHKTKLEEKKSYKSLFPSEPWGVFCPYGVLPSPLCGWLDLISL